jgi:hypothetical protein
MTGGLKGGGVFGWFFPDTANNPWSRARVTIGVRVATVVV